MATQPDNRTYDDLMRDGTPIAGGLGVRIKRADFDALMAREYFKWKGKKVWEAKHGDAA